MKQLPNIITSLRIAGSSGLLLCDVTGLVFWIIYGLCGISDIADGWLFGTCEVRALHFPSHTR